MANNPVHRKFLLFAAVLLLLTGSGCDNELKVNAEWKEVPIIYGLLNPTAQYNYLRINRAWLNEDGNALDFARVSDSIQFDSLEVRLIELYNGIETMVIDLEKVIGDTVGIQKDEGLFSSMPNVLYRTGYPIKASSVTEVYQYKLEVYNPSSGKLYRSETVVPGKIELLSPFQFSNPRVNFVDDKTRKVVFSYREGRFVRMYDLVARFRYEEYSVDDPGNVRLDSADWVVVKGYSTNSLEGFVKNYITVDGDQFYNFLENVLDKDSSLHRRPVDMGFYFYGGAEDLHTYQEVNRPSLGIVQKKPEFSNIRDGLGLFSSTHISSWDHVAIGDQMWESLLNSERMMDYQFEQ